MNPSPESLPHLTRFLGRRYPLGQLAIMNGMTTPAQLGECLEEQRKSGDKRLLGALLVARGCLTEDQLDTLLRQQKKLDDLEARGSLPASLESIVRIVGRHVVTERLGGGGAGVVWKAWDLRLRRWVAIKESKLEGDVARQRFLREAQAAARLSHPHVVAVHDFGEEEGRAHVVMELVEGKPLHRVLEEDMLPLRSRVELLVKVAEGVQHAHEHGIVHRDLKPQNILVTPAGEPKVADFGLAHLEDSTMAVTRTGATLGTPMYMAPEQVNPGKGEVTAKADVYALGAMLYEILSGRAPHAGESLPKIFAAILTEDPVRPGKSGRKVPSDLETIAFKALEKDPARRYPSARAFSEDLRRHLAGEPIEAKPAGTLYRAYRNVKRNPEGYGLAAVAFAAVAAVGILWGARETAREEALEQVRKTGRLVVDTALKLRRAGANEEMPRLLPELERAYRRAAERAPDLAEPDYLMGRMYRGLMEDEKALHHQELALLKDARYAPALYEHAVLLSKKYGSLLNQAYAAERSSPSAARKTADDVERERPDLKRLRDVIVEDCENLKRVLQAAPKDQRPAAVSEANVLAAQGILAYHYRRYAEAQKILHDVVKKDPLLEEAWETLALTVWDQPSSSIEEMERKTREAADLYTQGLSHDQGYLPHLLGRAKLRHLIGDTRWDEGGDPLPDYATAERDLTKALSAAPVRAPTLRMRAAVRTERGWYKEDRGEDPLPDYDGAQEDLEEASREDAQSGETRLSRGGLRIRCGIYRMSRGGDPTPDLAEAERELTEALRWETISAGAHLQRGYVRTQRGIYRMSRGEDPLGDYETAEKDFTEALRLRGESSGVFAHRGQTRTLRGAYRLDRGEDPRPDFEAAGADLAKAKALRLHKGDFLALEVRGDLLLRWGLYRKSCGEDPRPDWAGAEEDLTQNVTLYKGYSVPWAQRGTVRSARGAWLMERGEDPRSEFEAAEKDLEEALRLNKGHAEAWAARGDLRSCQASFREKAGDADGARRSFAAVVQDFESAFRIHPGLERRFGDRLKAAQAKLRELERR